MEPGQRGWIVGGVGTLAGEKIGNQLKPTYSSPYSTVDRRGTKIGRLVKSDRQR